MTTSNKLSWTKGEDGVYWCNEHQLDITKTNSKQFVLHRGPVTGKARVPLHKGTLTSCKTFAEGLVDEEQTLGEQVAYAAETKVCHLCGEEKASGDFDDQGYCSNCNHFDEVKTEWEDDGWEEEQRILGGTTHSCPFRAVLHDRVDPSDVYASMNKSDARKLRKRFHAQGFTAEAAAPRKRDPIVAKLMEQLNNLWAPESEEDDAITAYYGVQGMVTDMKYEKQHRLARELWRRARRVNDVLAMRYADERDVGSAW